MINFQTKEIQELLRNQIYRNMKGHKEFVRINGKNYPSKQSIWGPCAGLDIAVLASSELDPFDFCPQDWKIITQPNTLYVVFIPKHYNFEGNINTIERIHTYDVIRLKKHGYVTIEI